MNEIKPFTFKRSRGIVWACDMVKSSTYINSDSSIDELESFIPRFYYVAKLLIESYGGEFLKWTGDGFLAWFELELDRKKQVLADQVFDAATQLTLISNITQFGLSHPKKFMLRHGITYEQDALLMTLVDTGTSRDIIGRSVVLAFRLSNISSDFPSIVTVKELAFKNRKYKKWMPSNEEKLKYFKGENYGTRSLYVSILQKTSKRHTTKSTIRNTQNAINKAESKYLNEPNESIVIFLEKMKNGPSWTKGIIDDYLNFIKIDLLGTLKELIPLLKKTDKLIKEAEDAVAANHDNHNSKK